MGLAFSVGSGNADINTIKEMLHNPKFCSNSVGHPIHKLAIPQGLHLADVIYYPEDLTDSTDDKNNLPIGSSTEYPTPNIEW